MWNPSTTFFPEWSNAMLVSGNVENLPISIASIKVGAN